MTFDLTNPDRTRFIDMPPEAQVAILSAIKKGELVEIFRGGGWTSESRTVVVWLTNPYRIPPRRHQINWDHVADHLVCMATAINGHHWLMSDDADHRDGYWISSERAPATAFTSFVPGDMTWGESLVWRPGHGPK